MWTQLGPKEVTVPSGSSNSGVSIDWAGSLTRPLLEDDFGKPFLQFCLLQSRDPVNI